MSKCDNPALSLSPRRQTHKYEFHLARCKRAVEDIVKQFPVRFAALFIIFWRMNLRVIIYPCEL